MKAAESNLRTISDMLAQAQTAVDGLSLDLAVLVSLTARLEHRANALLREMRAMRGAHP